MFLLAILPRILIVRTFRLLSFLALPLIGHCNCPFLFIVCYRRSFGSTLLS
jgi:hypothetical protein